MSKLTVNNKNNVIIKKAKAKVKEEVEEVEVVEDDEVEEDDEEAEVTATTTTNTKKTAKIKEKDKVDKAATKVVKKKVKEEETKEETKVVKKKVKEEETKEEETKEETKVVKKKVKVKEEEEILEEILEEEEEVEEIQEVKSSKIKTKNKNKVKPTREEIKDDNFKDGSKDKSSQIYLFYDKFAVTHQYDNKETKMITIQDLIADWSYKVHTNIEFYNSKFPENFRLPTLLETSQVYKPFIYNKLINNIETILVVIRVNTSIIEECISKKQPVPHEEFLKTLCRFHITYTQYSTIVENSYTDALNINNPNKTLQITQNSKFITQTALRAVDYTFDPKIVQPKEVTLKLYDHQKATVKWMIDKETSKATTIQYNMNDEVIMNNIYYDNYNQKFDLVKNRKQLTFSGGGLIDEVGNGKTIQMISLCILNPPQKIDYVRQEDKSKLFSRASLVIAPIHLVKQWENEISKHTSLATTGKIYLIQTKRDFDKHTYQQFLDADLVIVSNSFFKNEHYTKIWSEKISTVKSFYKAEWSNTDKQQVKSLFTKMGTDLTSSLIDNLKKTNCLIQLIHWNRLIVDEFHEIYSNKEYNYMANILPYIASTHRWIVTGTPFINENSLYNSFNFLVNFKNEDGILVLRNASLVDYLSLHCFRRNTKDSVKLEHTIPPLQEVVKWLKFSATERMMYNAYLANPNNNKYDVFLRQLCCHPQLAEETKLALSNCKTLEDIEKTMTSHYENEAKTATTKVATVEKRLKRANNRLILVKNNNKKRQLVKIKKELNIKVNKEEEEELDNIDNIKLEDDANINEEPIILIELDGLTMLKELKVKIADYTPLLKKINEDNLTIINQQDVIKDVIQKLALAKKELEGKQATLMFFTNVIEKLRATSTTSTSTSSNKEDCGICLGEINEEDVGVTKCGHIFCYECLKLTVSKFYNCPYCKKKLDMKDIFMLSYEKKKKILNKDEQKKEDLINEIGTKLANLIYYLKESQEHTIIFSQWPDLLLRTRETLKENNIPSVLCKGNCYLRGVAISEFNNNDKIKVIMLSSDNAASGTNLTKASQIIFIDPIYGEYKHRKDQEMQAIGRAHRLGQTKSIKIVRFVIKDSVEEDIFLKNQLEDSKIDISKDATKVDTKVDTKVEVKVEVKVANNKVEAK